MSLQLSSPLQSSSLILPLSTTNGHLSQLLPFAATCPAFTLRRRFTSKPTFSPTFPRSKPLCCSSSSMPLELSSSPSQDRLLRSRAYWVSESIIAWNVYVSDGSCYLYASKNAVLSVTDDGIQGEDMRIKLQVDSCRLPTKVVEKFPHNRDFKAFRVPSNSDVKSLLKCQLSVATFNSDGKCSDVTGIQLSGVLDELYSYDGPLGVLYSEEDVSLYLWAPTAQAVCASIYRYPSGGDPLETIELKETDAVWKTKGPKSWEGCYYVYEVSVYHPSTLQIEKCYASDPYARGLSSNGRRTLFVNLDSDTLKPDGWANLADEKSDIPTFSDISIYELHTRDFRTLLV